MTEDELREIVGTIVEMCNDAVAQGVEVCGEPIEALLRWNLPRAEAEWEIKNRREEERRQKEIARMTDEEYSEFLRHRREAGLKIHPATAEVCWFFEPEFDRYGLGLDPSSEQDFSGLTERRYFARSPGSDIWVEFDDLPVGTKDALWEMHGRKLAFICVQEASASLTNLNYEDLKKGAVEK
jgi:hypothetical protein